uniref:UPAR/Ly6 domain-containing protein n=1 Tax=Caenorhabditis tropicalis TaxID=1561998 RepID=A0A1I7TP58_9PELO
MTSSLAIFSVLALLCLVPYADSIRCYDYTSTNLVRNNMKTWVDCPADAQYCYKSYLESRDFNNDKTYVEGRACGSSNLCIQNGCVGTNTDKACCCRGELCNSSSLAKLSVSILTLLAVWFFKN